MNFFNTYSLKARVFPAIVSVLPLLILVLKTTNKELNELVQDVLALKIVGNVGISVILIYLLSQIGRFLGKEVFEANYFKDEVYMPTTEFMLFQDENFSDGYKIKLRKLIEKQFDIQIPKELEKSNVDEARRRIVEAVGLMRNKVRDSKMLLQHNIEYGFMRNLIGGSPIGLLVSLFNVYYFLEVTYLPALFILSIILSIFFFVLLILSKTLINRYGKLYAKRLFQEYLTKFD